MRYPFVLVFGAAVALLFLALTLRPARAGSWEVTYTATGQYTCGGWNGNGATWDLHPVPYPGGGGWVTMLNGTWWPTSMDGGCDGNVSANLTWVPDPGKTLLTDPPPARVSFVESVSVSVSMPDSPPTNLLEAWAMDGFGDEMLRTDGGGAVCAGSHPKCLPVPSDGIVSLRPVRLWAIAHAVHRNDPCQIITDASYKIEFAQITVLAGSTGPNMPMSDKPRFLSGTGCEVSGAVTLPEGSAGILEATIRVGGEVAARWTLDQEYARGSRSAHLNATIDSTHFADGTPLPVTLWVQEIDNTEHDRSIWIPVYNKALVLSCQSVRGADAERMAVASALQITNHGIFSSETMTGSEILSDLKYETVFFTSTHGKEVQFADCFNNEPTDVKQQDATAAVSQKATSDLGFLWPPYRLVMINSCHSAGGDPAYPCDIWYDAFHIDAYDSAFLGLTDFTYSTPENSAWIKRFWNFLSQGECVIFAARKSDEVGPFIGGPGFFLLPLPGSDLYPIELAIVGDLTTKVHGVWGAAGLQWAEQW